MTTPKRTDPLTREEVAKASDTFFDLFAVVLDDAPEGTSIEDALKMSETIFTLAHKLRSDDLYEDKLGRFGFNKKES
jgi:hypothetical protein